MEPCYIPSIVPGKCRGIHIAIKQHSVKHDVYGESHVHPLGGFFQNKNLKDYQHSYSKSERWDKNAYQERMIIMM